MKLLYAVATLESENQEQKEPESESNEDVTMLALKTEEGATIKESRQPREGRK